MSHVCLFTKDIKYDYDRDILILDFLSSRVSPPFILSGFDKDIVLNSDGIHEIEIPLQTSTQSHTETTQFIDSFAEFIPNNFSIGDNIGIWLCGSKILNFTINNTTNILVDIFKNIQVDKLGNFTIEIKNNSIIFKSPLNTGVYYNGFELIVTKNSESFNTLKFSGGKTIYSLELISQPWELKYNLQLVV
jgi:hypothetical protein